MPAWRVYVFWLCAGAPAVATITVHHMLVAVSKSGQVNPATEVWAVVRFFEVVHPTILTNPLPDWKH